MMTRFHALAVCCTVFFSNAIAESSDALINGLLLAELESVDNDSLKPSWVYSMEGGIIKYAEFDLVGDDEPEVIYDRSNQGSLYKIGSSPKVYTYESGGNTVYSLPDNLHLEGFHKKENGKSVILRASSGINYDTPEEKAFTRKLIIQELATDGITNTVHIIDDSTSQEIRELWEASNSYYDKKSASRMEDLGYIYYKPEYKWVSLKGYLNGDEWETYVDNGDEWIALNEFSIDSKTWRIREEWATPEHLSFARQIHSLFKSKPYQYETGIPHDVINFPENYFLPADALLTLNGLIAEAGKVIIREKSFENKIVEPHASSSGGDSKETSREKSISSSDSQPRSWQTIVIIGLGLIALLGIALGFRKLSARP